MEARSKLERMYRFMFSRQQPRDSHTPIASSQESITAVQNNNKSSLKQFEFLRVPNSFKINAGNTIQMRAIPRPLPNRLNIS